MISVEGLTKYYGENAAIKDLAFRIAKGEVIGFLGLNGAGKSTTLKVLGCVLAPTSGRVTVDGYDVVENPHEIRKRIGQSVFDVFCNTVIDAVDNARSLSDLTK